MNKFEEKFFKKYIPEWQEIINIIHSHPLKILWPLFIWVSLWVLLPTFMYYFSQWIRNIIQFHFLELFLYIVYMKIIYNIFDWYNDVWIITDKWVTELDWKLLKTKMKTIEYEKIEWMEVILSWPLDKIFRKWDLIIHKMWNETSVLYDAMSPYKGINQIEKLKNEIETNIENHDNKKISLIMNSLNWVVEEYLDKKLGLNDNEKENLEILKKYQNDKKTLNLRDF